MEREQAIKLVQQLLTLMKQKNGSDLFISAGFPPAIKVDGAMTPSLHRHPRTSGIVEPRVSAFRKAP